MVVRAGDGHGGACSLAAATLESYCFLSSCAEKITCLAILFDQGSIRVPEQGIVMVVGVVAGARGRWEGLGLELEKAWSKSGKNHPGNLVFGGGAKSELCVSLNICGRDIQFQGQAEIKMNISPRDSSSLK